MSDYKLPKVDYPTFLYKEGGPHFGPPGKTYGTSEQINNDAQLEAALEDGFQLNLLKACGLEPADPKPSEARAALAAKKAPAKPADPPKKPADPPKSDG